MKKTGHFSAVGIIAEYNPLHSGHEYQIKQAKTLSGADYCIAVMSGDYVQRGAPAIYGKHIRTAMALSAGVDLVIEMPGAFACGSAEDFASCGVALLDRLSVVTTLCFGSECGAISLLSEAASVLAAEPPVYIKELKLQLKKGLAFPKARHEALLSSGCLSAEAADTLSSPNNILGIEYCKALIKRDSSIAPLTITRAGNSYHDSGLHGEFCSASGIREAIKQGNDLSAIKQWISPSVLSLMEQSHPLFPDDFSLLLNYALLKIIREGKKLNDYADVSDELASRLLKSSLSFGSYEDRILQLKTRQYTYTRISRALLHILLSITKDDINAYQRAGYAPYARVLGFRKSAKELLSAIKMRGTIPLITKTAGADRLLTGPAKRMFEQDLYGSHLYQSAVQNKYGILLKNEYTHPVVVLP